MKNVVEKKRGGEHAALQDLLSKEAQMEESPTIPSPEEPEGLRGGGGGDLNGKGSLVVSTKTWWR